MSIFKAYDIRGVYPDEIQEETVRKIGMGFARLIGPGRIGVGRDMRTSSPGLAEAFIGGLRAGGATAVELGMISTPMLYYAVGSLGLDGGTAVTASHNPAMYNGLKFCRENAIPVGSDSGLGKIERWVSEGLDKAPSPGGREQADIHDGYVEHLMGFADEGRPLKVVVDGANGMVGPTLSRVLARLRSEFVTLFMEPDGTFPNHEANPIKLENLRHLIEKVRETGADMGASFDGDADRCVFVDETGRMIPGDITTAVLAKRILKAQGPHPVVYDLRSSMVVEEEVRAAGGEPIRQRVGHSFIKATMREKGAVFGGELSGHYYFRENFTADSAEIAFLSLLSLVSSQDAPLSALVEPVMRYSPTGEVNFKIADKDAMITRLGEIFSDGEQDFLDGITVRYPDWWFNVRKSNTEPMLRLNLEGRTPALRDEHFARLRDILGEPI